MLNPQFNKPFNKLGKIILSMAFLLPGASAFAADSDVVAGVRNQLRALGATTNSSFCYVVENGEVQGINSEQPVRIASVMKLMTTFWAIEKLGGPNTRLSTRIFYRPATREMHIAGSSDPFLTRDRLYLLLSDLNKSGIKSVNRLTTDRNFRMGLDLYAPGTTLSESHSSKSLSVISPEDLIEVFNSSNWWNQRKGYYANLKRNNPSLDFSESISFSVQRANVVSTNPLAGKSGVQILDFKSAPLHTYLKKMNILSNNPVADEVFWALGGPGEFNKFLQQKYKMANAAANVHTGSGLPYYDPKRNDTTMSCVDVVRLIRRLDLDLEQKHKMDLADVMMIAGVDTEPGATFKDGTHSLIVKTGTLTASGAVAKNLAGVMQTTSGEVYFGIFMNGRGANSGGVRSVLSQLMSKYNKVPVKRRSFSFKQLDSEMKLKSVSYNHSPNAPLLLRRN